MDESSRQSLIFTVAFLVLFVGPAFLGQPFPPYDLMKWGDVLDLLTPLILMPLYLLLFLRAKGEGLGTGEGLVFSALAGLWVLGQGMHLAANSIGHLLADLRDSEIYQLTYFYDEVLSHYLWHAGVIALSILIVRADLNRTAAGERTSWGRILPAGVVYGITYFLIIIEGGTLPMGLPLAVAVVAYAWVRGRASLAEKPLLAYFSCGYASALLLFAGWGLYWGGFPQFSEVGLL